MSSDLIFKMDSALLGITEDFSKIIMPNLSTEMISDFLNKFLTRPETTYKNQIYASPYL